MEFGCEIPFKDKWSTFFFLLRRFPIDGVLPVVLSNCRYVTRKTKSHEEFFQFLTYKLDKHYKRKERFFHLRFLKFLEFVSYFKHFVNGCADDLSYFGRMLS